MIDAPQSVGRQKLSAIIGRCLYKPDAPASACILADSRTRWRVGLVLIEAEGLLEDAAFGRDEIEQHAGVGLDQVRDADAEESQRQF